MLLIFLTSFDIVIISKKGGSPMSKKYSEPLIEFRKYEIVYDIFTTSNPEDDNHDLNDDDAYDYFGN